MLKYFSLLQTEYNLKISVLKHNAFSVNIFDKKLKIFLVEIIFFF